MKHYDVVIVGGAIVGSSTAYYLRKNGFKGSVAVVEKDPTYSKSATTLSWGGIRGQFSTPENILLAQFGLKLLFDIKKEFGPEADLNFKEQGYLVMATEASVGTLEANMKLQNEMGADTVMYRANELPARFPHINFHGIAAATWGRSREGWFDPHSLLTLIRKGAAARGVDYIHDEVIAIDAGEKVNSVTLKNAGKIGAGAVVNAAGPYGGEVAAMVGFDLPVSAAKRYVYVVDCPAAPESLRKGPLTFDVNGTYFRPEGRNFIWGYTPTDEEEPKVKDWDVDFALYEDKVWPLIAERVPAFETVKMVSSYVGHYDYNWFDHNGIISRHPSFPNFYFGNGFSGHGIQQGPATGNAISELIMHGEFRAIDLKRMSVGRIARGEKLLEKNIF